MTGTNILVQDDYDYDYDSMGRRASYAYDDLSRCGGTSCVAIHASGDGFWNLNFYDSNRTTTATADATAVTVTPCACDQQGNLAATSGVFVAFSPLACLTQCMNNATVLYYYGLRFYNPGLGRWESRDPLMERGFIRTHGGNLWLSLFNAMRARTESADSLDYAFVANRPVREVDYLGAFIFCSCSAMVNLQLPGPCIPGDTAGGVKYTGTCLGRWKWSDCLCGQACNAIASYTCAADGSRWMRSGVWYGLCP